MEDKAVLEELAQALRELFEKDGKLLENDVHEQAVSCRLAGLLAVLFSDWNVDVEYNRDQKKSKQMPDPRNPERVVKVRPDIIVHKRRTSKNLLVVEVKKSGRNKDFDEEKLKRFTLKREQGDYGYQLGVWLVLPGEPRLEKVKAKVFKEGQLHEDLTRAFRKLLAS